MNLKALRTICTKAMFILKGILGTWKLSPENMQLCLNRTLLPCGEIKVFSNYIADPVLKYNTLKETMIRISNLNVYPTYAF